MMLNRITNKNTIPQSILFAQQSCANIPTQEMDGQRASYQVKGGPFRVDLQTGKRAPSELFGIPVC
jgi:hypothetical protein